jgi:hypothetical protein
MSPQLHRVYDGFNPALLPNSVYFIYSSLGLIKLKLRQGNLSCSPCQISTVHSPKTRQIFPSLSLNTSQVMASPRQYQNVPMEFKRSVPHPIEAFETDPDFPYTFRPRMSDTAHLTADACWTCRDDLKKAGWKGSLAVGCLNDISGHFVAAVFPEGLADKFDPLSYLSEYAFIHDGKGPRTF